MKRRILPMIMAVIMILSIIQMPAWAATGDDPAGEDGNPGQVSEQPVEESAEPSAPVEEEPASNELPSLPDGETEEEPAPEERAENYVAEVNGQGFPTLQAAIDAAGEGDTITLCSDINATSTDTIRVDDNIILDLKGYSISYTLTGNTPGICVLGELKIQDSTATTSPQISEDYENITYSSGIISSDSSAWNDTIRLQEGGRLTVESGTIKGIKGDAIDIYGGSGNPVNTEAIITGGYLEAEEYGIFIGQNDAVLDIQGGVIVSKNNNAVGGTGSSGNGGTTINISDGTLIGHIVAEGYIACGIYHPQNGTLNISGGTIYADGGVGILMRGGTANITGGTIIGSGTVNGRVGDSEIQVACSGIVYDESATYPGMSDSDKISISGDTIVQATGENVPAVNVMINASTPKDRAVISGGTFSSDVSKYLDPSSNITTDSNGDWVVAPLTGENATASVGDKYYNSLSAAIAAAGDGDTVTLLKDNETTDTIVVSENLTLDLHGCTLTLSQPQSKEPQFVVSSTGDLTIRDTLGNGKMDITGSLGVKSGKLTLESGTIESDYYGIYVYDNGTAVINGGTINSKYAGLSGNNTTGDMNFEVNGGKLNTTDGPAIYMPGQMTLKITGGTLNGGISLRMGQVTISGGTINATAGSIDDPKDYYNKSENAWLPDALYVFNGTYGSGNETYGNALNLTITGGTFNCANGQGSAIAIYDIGKVSQESAVTISGNAELSTNAENREAYQVLSLKDIGVENPDTGYGNTEFVGKADTSISGGTFSSVVKEEYCADGFEPVTTPGSDGKYTVEVANDMTAKIVDANGNDVAAYETLDAALTHVTPGQTIALLANVEYNGKVSIPEGVTLDGNGNAITATAEITSGAFIEVMTDNVTIKDLVVNTNGKAKHGIQFYQTKGGELSGVTVNGGSYTSVIVNGSTDIRIENCTLNPGSGAYANIEYAMGSGVTTVPSVTVSNPKYDSGKPLVYVDSATIKAITNEANPSDKDIADALEQVNKNVTISGMEMVWVNGSFVARPIPTPVDPGDDDDDDNNNSGSSSVRRYDIEADAGRGGDISPDGRVRVRRGENQTFRITADDGYEIYDVEVDGESVGAVSRYTFENVREDHTISATFRQTGAQTEEAQLPFLDVAEGAWYYDAVTYCYENGIMDGTSSVSFAPGMLLNRAMAAQVLYNLADGTASTAAGFPDVAASAWYADAVNWAAANGYVTGYDNGSFGPEDSLTREQLAVILYRYAGSPEPTGSLDGFTDAASASDYAVDALRWAVGEGLLTGKDGGRLDPAGTASRAELAQILARFAQM